jgi:hypothetical protein
MPGRSRERFGGGFGPFNGGFGNFFPFTASNIAAFGLTILPNGSIYSNFTGAILSGIVASNISTINTGTNPAIDVRTGAVVG